MTCNYFGECGSCTLFNKTYEEQLKFKIQREQERFQEFTTKDFDIIKSEPQHFRNRAEFRFWKNFDEKGDSTLSYAMNSFDKKPLEIDNCSIISQDIAQLMPKLLASITHNHLLKFKIYACEFLNATTGDMLVTLIYHKKLDEQWEIAAKELEKQLNIHIIGRSRGQKVILSKDYIEEKLSIKNETFTFHYQEGGFTQPNTKVNVQMIEWVLNNMQVTKDLCELYCGGGNFTIPLAQKFEKVLATEISKTSINSAKKNCSLNKINNIKFIRMSAQEFVEALAAKREYRRLQQENVDLQEYTFGSNSNQKSTIFVDPPRAGLDETTRALTSKFDQIIYISCNPETLHRDLKSLTKTHQILKFALFDQFSYTNHIECGLILTKY